MWNSTHSFFFNEKMEARRALCPVHSHQRFRGWAGAGVQDFPLERSSSSAPTGNRHHVGRRLFISLKTTLFAFLNNPVLICISLITNAARCFPTSWLRIFPERVALPWPEDGLGWPWGANCRGARGTLSCGEPMPRDQTACQTSELRLERDTLGSVIISYLIPRITFLNRSINCIKL